MPRYFFKVLGINGHDCSIEADCMYDAVKQLQAKRKLAGVITHPAGPGLWEIESDITHKIIATITGPVVV